MMRMPNQTAPSIKNASCANLAVTDALTISHRALAPIADA